MWCCPTKESLSSEPEAQLCWVDISVITRQLPLTLTVKNFYALCTWDCMYFCSVKNPTYDDRSAFAFDTTIQPPPPGRAMMGDVIGLKAFSVSEEPRILQGAGYNVISNLEKFRFTPEYLLIEDPQCRALVFSYHQELDILKSDAYYFNRPPIRSEYLFKYVRDQYRVIIARRGIAMSGLFNFILNPHHDPRKLDQIHGHYISIIPDSDIKHAAPNTTVLTVSEVRVLMWRYIRNFLHYLSPRHVDWIIAENPLLKPGQRANSILARTNPDAHYYLNNNIRVPAELRQRLSFHATAIRAPEVTPSAAATASPPPVYMPFPSTTSEATSFGLPKAPSSRATFAPEMVSPSLSGGAGTGVSPEASWAGAGGAQTGAAFPELPAGTGEGESLPDHSASAATEQEQDYDIEFVTAPETSVVMGNRMAGHTDLTPKPAPHPELVAAPETPFGMINPMYRNSGAFSARQRYLAGLHSPPPHVQNHYSDALYAIGTGAVSSQLGRDGRGAVVPTWHAVDGE